MSNKTTNHQPPATSLSIIIIAKNEEKMIKGCLESVSWADEVVLVDSGSTDRTIKICKEIIPEIKIIETKKGNCEAMGAPRGIPPWSRHNVGRGVRERRATAKGWNPLETSEPGERVSFSDWRNQGLKNASGLWVLYIDADERVSLDLQKEIKEVIKNNNYDYFIIPRLNNLLGKDMRHGGWYPDYVTRLFKKAKISHWQGKIHESPVAKGKKGQLKNELKHITHQSLSDMILKSLKWAHLEAEQFYEKKSPSVSWRHLLILPLKEFLRRVILLKGFQDGIKGFIEGVMQAFNKFLVFAYLWEMQRKGKS